MPIIILSIFILTSCQSVKLDIKDHSLEAQSALNRAFSISSPIRGRENSKYLYIPIPSATVQSIGKMAQPEIRMINHKIAVDRKKNRHNIEAISLRLNSHIGQPFHDIPAHFTLAINPKATRPLQHLRKELPSLNLQRVNLSFEVTKIKLIGPTMNGSLSLVCVVKFDEKSQLIADQLSAALKERPKYNWHITIGQSFYQSHLAKTIYKTFTEQQINLTRVKKSEFKPDRLKKVVSALNTIEQQKQYFQETLMPFLINSRGYQKGFWQGKLDHILLPLNPLQNKNIRKAS